MFKTTLFAVLLMCASKIQAQKTADSDRVVEFVKDVYLNCPVYQNDELIAIHREQLTRTIFHEVALDEYPECALLSSAGRKDKCNPGLDYSLENFSMESFNPLKYHFQFDSPNAQYYRVDGKNIIIEIRPKNAK